MTRKLTGDRNTVDRSKNLFLAMATLGSALLVSCAAGRLPREHVMLPGISITENISKDTVENNIYDRYQESYWRVNDLINKELLLSFYLDSSFFYGQTTLTLKPYFYPYDSLVLVVKGFRFRKRTEER